MADDICCFWGPTSEEFNSLGWGLRMSIIKGFPGDPHAVSLRQGYCEHLKTTGVLEKVQSDGFSLSQSPHSANVG